MLLAGAGAPSGLRVAAPDLLDIKGAVTGPGNPDRLAAHAHAPATETAASARVIGKTATDELGSNLGGGPIPSMARRTTPCMMGR
jgi:hypothetical protein